jgi:hypothetical protein
MATISVLPRDCWMKIIMENIEPWKVGNLIAVCKSMQALFTEQAIWQQFYDNFFAQGAPSVKKDWKVACSIANTYRHLENGLINGTLTKVKTIRVDAKQLGSSLVYEGKFFIGAVAYMMELNLSTLEWAPEYGPNRVVNRESLANGVLRNLAITRIKGEMIGAASNEEMIYQLGSPAKIVNQMRDDAKVLNLKFDDDVLISFNQHGQIKRWSLNTQQLLRAPMQIKFEHIDFTAHPLSQSAIINNNLVVIIGGNLVAYNLQTGACLTKKPHQVPAELNWLIVAFKTKCLFVESKEVQSPGEFILSPSQAKLIDWKTGESSDVDSSFDMNSCRAGIVYGKYLILKRACVDEHEKKYFNLEFWDVTPIRKRHSS